MGLTRFFAEVIAGDTLPTKKPDPAPLLYACERFGIAPREMLMIGDSLNDAQAARAAGCPVFCVDYGYNEGQDVRELDVDAIVPSLAAATRLIQKA
jgi:phosphoglycolate phosphatase